MYDEHGGGAGLEPDPLRLLVHLRRRSSSRPLKLVEEEDRGESTSARAIATRRAMPPEICDGIRLSEKPSSPTSCSISLRQSIRSLRGTPASCGGSAVLSRQFRHGSSTGSWKTKPKSPSSAPGAGCGRTG